MVIASVGLHALLLFAPMPSQPDSEELAEPPAEALDTIQVARVAPPPNPVSVTPPADKPVNAEPPPQAKTNTPAQSEPRRAPEPKPDQPATEEPSTEPPSNPDQPSTSTPAPTPIPVPTPAPTLEQRLLDRKNYTYDGSKTGQIVAASNFNDFYMRHGAFPAQKEIPVEYPLPDCLDTPPLDGSIGVVIDANGVLKDEPEILGSTGYGILDDKAIADIKAWPFNPAEGQVYTFRVRVNYDACATPN